MIGPSVVCAGCGGPASFVKPICDACVRATGGSPLTEVQTILAELGMQRHKKPALHQATTADAFNLQFRLGDYVVVTLDDGSEWLTQTRSEAWSICDGRRHVVLLLGKTGGFSLERIRGVAWEPL